jgi:DNA-binding winged helix-turn-helix (wHTH) protein
MQVHFDRFVFDSEARELRSNLGPLHLSPKAFQLLETLLEHRPKALSKSELQGILWPGTFVVEANLANLVAEIRAALGDERGRRRFVRTVHGFGYAFREDPAPPRAEAALLERLPEAGEDWPAQWLVWDGRVIPLEPGENVLGRGEGVAVRIASLGVSRHHARIVVSEGEATLEDLGSKNGTYVRDRRIETPARLADGDTFRLGRQALVFHSSALDGSTFTEATGRKSES